MTRGERETVLVEFMNVLGDAIGDSGIGNDGGDGGGRRRRRLDSGFIVFHLLYEKMYILFLW